MNNLICCSLTILVLLQITSAQSLPDFSQYVQTNECEGGNGKVVGCTDDCKGRKFCLNDQIFNIDCYTQTGRSYCSPKTQECVVFSEGCDLGGREFTCPGKGYFPHPFNCTKFYDCKNGNAARLAECNNLVFDPLEEKCKSGIQCYTFSSQNGLCRGKLGAVVVHPLNKRLYVICESETPLMGQCAEDLVFNTAKLGCEYGCKSRGRFEDKADPKCYYECSIYLKAIHNCCVDGQIYNDEFKACMPV